MSTRVIVGFEITGWEEISKEETPDRVKFSEVKVSKKFHGELEGTSVASLQMCGASDESGGSYIAQERFDGKLGDKTGSFVLHHGGIYSGTTQKTFGNIVPGSGTGDLRGLRGETEFAHDDQGARLTLDYRFES